MEIEEIISEKDRILNELFEGLINPSAQTGNLKDLTPAQLYRQMALESFLQNDYHHRDLTENFDKSLIFDKEEFKNLSKKEIKQIKQKIKNYYRDAYELNKSAGRTWKMGLGFEGDQVLATKEFVNQFGLDPTALLVSKSKEITNVKAERTDWNSLFKKNSIKYFLNKYLAKYFIYEI